MDTFIEEAVIYHLENKVEIVVFVKESSDNTLKIAKEHATHVYEVDYCNASENVLNTIIFIRKE
mgnify:CR=1 FL=1